uniref:Centromere-associated protein E n=1 Tax=Sipha flava TaxID=143950 RepID=A0A2S2QFF0_9HEMI
MDACNIKVAIKARPLNHKEQLDGRVYWKIESDSVVHIDPITKKINGERFFFDRVFCGESTNNDVFDEIVKPIIDRGVQGFNGTVFAYGQTASGKTYTMAGDQSNLGIIPLAIYYMFSVMNSSTDREYLLRACYLEIYNEKVIDLLEKKDNKNQKKIEIQKDGLHITPLKAVVCQNAQMVIDLMKMGEQNRSFGETNMNERSSRSHTIFRIILESRNVDDDCDGAYQQSVINLVDLAGSEKSSQTQLSMERFKEGCKINSSLTTLGLVIQQLSECPDSSQFINFRDSKLTRILQTSLGGNSLTAIICTVTLAVEDQTQNTLSFASRAKKIRNVAKVNENVTDETLLKRYRVQLSKLNKELEGIKQNQYENDEVNEIKYKYQIEKRTNEELKERIMRLQNNMITSSVGHKEQPSNKKGYHRRRTWGGKLDCTFSSNSILETIEEDVNVPRPSVPSNFGNQNKEFKTPLEPFELDLMREEDRTIDIESIINDIPENEISPPCSIPFSVCETPKKVLRERVNNYKNMFEMSMKENNELREFTTLEKQMFHENNEQLKNLSILTKKVDDLQIEKNESAELIKKLQCSIKLIENEKRDVEVVMEMQKNKYEKREIELLGTIQETREELKLKEEQLKKVILNDTFMSEKQEEIKRLEMKIKEMSLLNHSYINEIETMKSQLINKDHQLNEELTKNNLIMNELSLLQNHVTESKSVTNAVQLLAGKGYFALQKHEIMELDKLLEHIHNTVEKLQFDNQQLNDENNNLKLITNDFTIQINNIKKENYDLKLQLNLIESNIRSVIKDFSGSVKIDVDNSDVNSLIEFAVNHFEKNTKEIDELSSKNQILNEKLTLSNNTLCDIKLFVFDVLDDILGSISSLEIDSTTEINRFKKELSETIEKNIFLKSSIQDFNKLTSECVEIVEKVKTNRSYIISLQKELAVSNAAKNEYQIQIEQLNELNTNLNTLIENQTKVEKEIQERLDDKSSELKDTLIALNEMKLSIKDYENDTNSNVDRLNIELQIVQSNLEEKCNLVNKLEETTLELSTKYNELERHYELTTKTIEQKEEIEKQLRDELIEKTNNLQCTTDELKEMKMKVASNESEIQTLNTLLESAKSENTNDLEQNNQLKKSVSELQLKLIEKETSESKIHEELVTKTKELEIVLSQVNVLQLNIDANINVIEKLNDELGSIKLNIEEKYKLIDEFEKSKLYAIKCNNLKLNETIIKLESELVEKSHNEEFLETKLNSIIIELNDTNFKSNELKSTIDILKNDYESNIEKLNHELEFYKFTVTEKISLIEELENVNSKLSNQISEKLSSKSFLIENALVDLNEIYSLVVTMENDLKSYILLTEQLKSELATKSDLLTNLETMNSELLVKCAEINETKLIKIKEDENSYKNLQDQFITVTEINKDLNLANQKYIELSKHHEETKLYLENTLKLQVSNYHKLYTEFINLSNDIESSFKLQMNTESNLRAEIVLKSTEIEYLQKQILESSLQSEYDKLEEEFMLRSRECDEAQSKIVNLESILLNQAENEKILKSNYKSKCIALEEYKKNVEFLFSRNDSFQTRVNDFEENVLVDLNEEFDSIKSELAKKTENEKYLLEEKANLECKLNELQEKLSSIAKEMELSEERTEDLASIIDVLVIELKDANSVKKNLECRLNEAEHDIIMTGDMVEHFERDLYCAQREYENLCTKTKFIENELNGLKSKLNDKIDKNNLESNNVRNQLFDPLVDYVHDIKLKLTELNSAMISGNRSEKLFRTKVMSIEDDGLPCDDEVWKGGSPLVSPNIGIDLEIDNLRKLLGDKIDLINSLQKDKNNVENSVNELQDQIKNLSNENNKLVNDMALMENYLKEKESLLSNLNNELSQLKIQYTTLEEHNQAIKEQIHHSLDIDSELRNGKKNLLNEINLLEPGKITGVLAHHNLSNLLDTFVSLIMTKEQQIVTDLVNSHNKSKQQYEDQIKQFQEDIKKGKEWQEQVESDNEKLCLELEILKSEKHNFPNREIEIKELTEKILEVENQAFDYLSELQELKTQFNKKSEQSYQALSNEFELFKTSSEQSIKELKTKLEDLTSKYNESLNLYKDQKNSRSTLESQVEKIQSECACLQAILEKKDEDIKNLFDQVQLKTEEYEKLLEKNVLQKKEMNDIHGKKIDELLLELNDKSQQIYNTDKLLKEVTKNYNQLLEENSSNVLKNKHNNDNSDLCAKIKELEFNIQTISEINKTKLKSLETELKLKNTKLEESEAQYSKVIQEFELNKLKIITLEKQLENSYETLKLKDDQIKNYYTKSKINDDNSVEINNTIDKFRKTLNCTGPLSLLYENFSSLVAKYEDLKEEMEELKLNNMNLDEECELMLTEIKSKDGKILELLTQEDELKQNIELLTEERDFLKNKFEQVKNVNDDIKKLNDEICGYEQNIYQLRKEKGQLIMAHDKEMKKLKSELNEVHTKNLELLNEYNKLSETAKNLEKSLKEDIQQLNRCIVDKNAKISTLELFSKTNNDELKKKNNELEHFYKRARDENHMLRKEVHRLKEITNVRKLDQYTQTVEEQSVVSSAMIAGNKSMAEKITKLENDNQVMKKMLHHRKIKIEELQKQLSENHS